MSNAFIHIHKLTESECTVEVEGDLKCLVGMLVSAMEHYPDVVAVVVSAAGIHASRSNIDFGKFWNDCMAKYF